MPTGQPLVALTIRTLLVSATHQKCQEARSGPGETGGDLQKLSAEIAPESERRPGKVHSARATTATSTDRVGGSAGVTLGSLPN